MPGNPLVRFDEGRVGRTARCHPLSYSTGATIFSWLPANPSCEARRWRVDRPGGLSYQGKHTAKAESLRRSRAVLP